LGLRRSAVLIAYLIVAGSAALLVVPLSLLSYNGYYPYYFGLGYPWFLLNATAVAGLILGPYFGLAGLIAKDKSVWFESNRMLHTHISVPIIGGFFLFWGSVSAYGIVYILPVYLIFVALGTLIAVMASRTAKPQPAPSATVATMPA
jgi:hypothetical protein